MSKTSKSEMRPQSASDGRKSNGHGRKTKATRESAILALLTEKSIGAAAKRAGVGERTLRRWLTEDAEFKAEYDEARRATFIAGMNRVQALTGKSVDTLEELLKAKKHPSVRLGAARTVVEIAIERHNAETIMLKLNEIEAAQRRQGRR